MPFDVEMTGVSDYGTKVKMIVAGQAGAGKTLFSSTAPEPLYIFFREQPRIMSIANRYMPHVKVLPELDENGKIKRGGAVEDKMLEILHYLQGEGGELYESVVIDTGDELQRAIKDGKKNRNNGKWAISDWGWLADEYFNIVNAFIDLPMHVIVTYHLKNTQEGDDGQVFREIALQGSAKDDTPSWFDIVGVLDSYESVDDKGIRSTSRGFLTQQTDKYRWTKDHSGQLPRVYELSPDFVGDFDRIIELIYEKKPGTPHEIIDRVKVETVGEPLIEHPGVPTPEEVEEKKQEKAESPIVDKIEEARAAAAAATALLKSELGATEVTDDGGGAAIEPAPDKMAEVEEGTAEPEPPNHIESEKLPDETVPMFGDEKEEEEPPAVVEEVTEDSLPHCEVCGDVPTTEKIDDKGEVVLDSDGDPVMIVDETLVSLGQVRYRKTLCQVHLLEERKK